MTRTPDLMRKYSDIIAEAELMEAKKKGNLSEPAVPKLGTNPAPTTADEKQKAAEPSPVDAKKDPGEPAAPQPKGPNAPKDEKAMVDENKSPQLKKYTGSEANETFKFYREYEDIVAESRIKGQ